MPVTADIHTIYPQDMEADTALGYTWHTRWKSSQKSITDNGGLSEKTGQTPRLPDQDFT